MFYRKVVFDEKAVLVSSFLAFLSYFIEFLCGSSTKPYFCILSKNSRKCNEE